MYIYIYICEFPFNVSYMGAFWADGIRAGGEFPFEGALRLARRWAGLDGTPLARLASSVQLRLARVGSALGSLRNYGMCPNSGGMHSFYGYTVGGRVLLIGLARLASGPVRTDIAPSWSSLAQACHS